MINFDYQPGSKGTLILIHGAGGSLRKWRMLMADLPSGYGGLALDLPGHGGSKGKAMADVGEYATAIRECIAKANPTRPLIWLGHSLGGAIVQMVALMDPTIVDYLILVGTGGRLRVVPDRLEALRQGIIDPKVKRLSFSQATAEELIQAEIAADLEVDPQVAYLDFLACNGFDVLTRLKEINQPALVIVGADDVSAPPKYSDFLVKNLPRASLVVIPQAGHMIMLEQPSQVKEAIAKFLSEQTGE